MHRIVTAAAALMLAVSGLTASAALADNAASDSAAPVVVVADLDGAPLAVADIPNHKCHDFDFPRIHCFAAAADLGNAVAAAHGDSATALTDYAVVYDAPNFAGGYLFVSQN